MLISGALVWYATHNILWHINILTLTLNFAKETYSLIHASFHTSPTVSNHFNTSSESMLGYESDEKI
jgi:hypothetical protein